MLNICLERLRNTFIRLPLILKLNRCRNLKLSLKRLKCLNISYVTNNIICPQSVMLINATHQIIRRNK